ncbi:thioredoxin family protein [Bacteroidota bacterium]
MSISIKVLGVGCSKCAKTYENVKDAVSELGIDAEVIKVEDIQDIINYGILMTPGLVINEQVVKSGSVPTAKEIKALLSAY